MRDDRRLKDDHGFARINTDKSWVDRVVPLKAFYDAEDYHQDYAEKNPDNPYIQVCDIPKVAALKAQFPELFQEYGKE